MEAGYDIVEDISCVDPSGKKMVLIRYPKDMNIKLLEKMHLKLNSKGDVVGEVSLDSTDNINVQEKYVVKRDNTVSRSIRPLVCSTSGKSKKSSKRGNGTTVGAGGLVVGNVFATSLSVVRQNEYVSAEPAVNTTLNIRPSYLPVAQLPCLKVVSLPFGSTSTLESVNNHKVSVVCNSKTPSKSAKDSNNEGEKSSKKKHKREKESEDVVETPSKKKSKKDKK